MSPHSVMLSGAGLASLGTLPGVCPDTGGINAVGAPQLPSELSPWPSLNLTAS